MVREGQREDRRPLTERIADVITDDGLEVGAEFPSASALSVKFGVSRPWHARAKALLRVRSAGRRREHQGRQPVPGTHRSGPDTEGVAHLMPSSQERTRKAVDGVLRAGATTAGPESLTKTPVVGQVGQGTGGSPNLARRSVPALAKIRRSQEP